MAICPYREHCTNMPQYDPDALAAEICEAVEVESHRPHDAVGLATAFLGHDSVLAVDPTEVWGDGELVPHGTRWRILVRDNLSAPDTSFTVLHELAHFWLKVRGAAFRSYIDQERTCDAVAACLQAPRPVFVPAMIRRGLKLAPLADEFRATQTAMALRIGEVSGRAVAVVSPGLVRTRGRTHPWPTLESLRHLPTSAPGRVDITDSPGRFAVFAA